MEALIHVAKTKLHPEQKKQMKTILLVILAMGRNCILEAPEPEPVEVIFGAKFKSSEIAIQIFREIEVCQFGENYIPT